MCQGIQLRCVGCCLATCVVCVSAGAGESVCLLQPCPRARTAGATRTAPPSSLPPARWTPTRSGGACATTTSRRRTGSARPRNEVRTLIPKHCQTLQCRPALSQNRRSHAESLHTICQRDTRL